MILTTTPSVEGRSIEEYRGIVFGEVISGVDVIKDFTAGLSKWALTWTTRSWAPITAC